jgi:hypothetical protein
MANETKFKVGDKVKITNPGRTYSTYDTMFRKLKFNNTEKNPSWREGTIGVIFAMDNHESSKELLLAVRSLKSNSDGDVDECLIHVNGVTRVITNAVTITRKDVRDVMKLQSICAEWRKKIAIQFSEFEDECMVESEFIKECHSEANLLVQEFLEKRFPDVFKKIEAISLINGNIDSDFSSYRIGTEVGIGIVKGLAGEDGIPKELRGRALYYNSSRLQLNVMEGGNNRSIIYFTKK